VIVPVPCVAEGRLYNIGSLVAMPPPPLEAGNEHQGEGTTHNTAILPGQCCFPNIVHKGFVYPLDSKLSL